MLAEINRRQAQCLGKYIGATGAGKGVAAVLRRYHDVRQETQILEILRLHLGVIEHLRSPVLSLWV